MGICTLTPRKGGWTTLATNLVILTAMTCVAVIIYYYVKESHEPGFQPTHFFGYFTVQTGVLFAAVQLPYLLSAPQSKLQVKKMQRTKWASLGSFMRYSFTVYAIMILPIYWLVVSPYGTWEFTNGWIAIHALLPIVAAVTWRTLSRTIAVRWWWPFAAVWYPALYAGTSLLRGTFGNEHWFPYEFLNYPLTGWGETGKWVIVMLAGVIAIGAILGATRRRTSTP